MILSFGFSSYLASQTCLRIARRSEIEDIQSRGVQHLAQPFYAFWRNLINGSPVQCQRSAPLHGQDFKTFLLRLKLLTQRTLPGQAGDHVSHIIAIADSLNRENRKKEREREKKK